MNNKNTIEVISIVNQLERENRAYSITVSNLERQLKEAKADDGSRVTMKLDGEKLLARLEMAKANHIRDKLDARRKNLDDEAMIFRSGECTIAAVIEEIMTGDYTIEDKG